MGASRKLQGEIDRVLKKVQEGVDVFDSIWNKVLLPLFTICFRKSSSFLCELWSNSCFLLFRFMIQTMRIRKKNLRRTWKRRLRSCRGIETRSRHGYSPARSRIKRYGARRILLNFAIGFSFSLLFCQSWYFKCYVTLSDIYLLVLTISRIFLHRINWSFFFHLNII